MNPEKAMIDEDQELIKIEKQSDELETLYKKLEHYRRENMLFNSYLCRVHDKKNVDKPLIDEDILIRKITDGVDCTLTIDQKYEIASTEAEVLKDSVKEGKKKSDALLETLKAVLDEADMAIIEIRKDAFDFQREILIGGENSRTGKIEAERIENYRRYKLKQKEDLKNKLDTKKKNLEHQINKIKGQLLKKQELGDDLKFIDFHQLQIENKKYMSEIKEKNAKLMKLKIATGKIVITWNKKKEDLNQNLEKKENILADIKSTKELIKHTDNEIEKYQEISIGLKTEVENLESKKNEKTTETTKMNVESFIAAKNEEKELLKQLRKFKRKIQIASLKYEKAVMGLRRMGEEISYDDVSLSEDQDY